MQKAIRKVGIGDQAVGGPSVAAGDDGRSNAEIAPLWSGPPQSWISICEGSCCKRGALPANGAISTAFCPVGGRVQCFLLEKINRRSIRPDMNNGGKKWGFWMNMCSKCPVDDTCASGTPLFLRNHIAWGPSIDIFRSPWWHLRKTRNCGDSRRGSDYQSIYLSVCLWGKQSPPRNLKILKERLEPMANRTPSAVGRIRVSVK